MAIRTIFSMAEDCARGERVAWGEFVRDFAGIARSLLGLYFPTLVPDLDGHVVALFRRAGTQTPQLADAGRPGDPVRRTWFTGLSFSNEREFMMAFRDLVFAYGREQEHVPAPGISLEQFRTTIQDLTLLERELLWLFIKGYDATRIPAIMMNAAGTTEAVQRIAAERLGTLVPGAAPGRFAAFARVWMELAEQSKTDQCVSMRTFNNLVNGQITWRERELAEEHMANCFYCIDRFTTFQEMVRLRKDVARLAAPQVEAILAQLPIAAAKPGGVFSRLFAAKPS